MRESWKKAVLPVLAIAVTAGMMQMCENRRIQEQIAQKVLRFHVIANSSGREDQELKLKVRDEVGRYLGEEMQAAGSRQEAEEIVRERLDEIEKIAQKVIREEGSSYPVSAWIGPVEFPVKRYGDYAFPAGTYEALEVVIGDGEGKNWWCVMYPNMCFQGSMYEVVDDRAGETLRKVLTQEEYESVLEEGDYKIRFKYLSFLNRR